MHDSETRALRRATVLLLIISALRWGWAWRSPASLESQATALPGLLDASRESVAEEERRSAPLGPDERVDPNRAGEVELDRLPGVGPSLARAILAAREAGAVFSRPDDLLAVRGIGGATLERILPLLDLSSPPASPGRRPRVGASEREAGGPSTPVDVNRADAADLQRLPGVGPAIAERIRTAREERMFSSVDDLLRVRGIGPGTLERLRPYATVGPVR